MVKYLKDQISPNQVKLVIQVNLQKGQEVAKNVLHTKDNVRKEMQTLTEMTKDAKAQAKHAQKEIKTNSPFE